MVGDYVTEHVTVMTHFTEALAASVLVNRRRVVTNTRVQVSSVVVHFNQFNSLTLTFLDV